MVVRIKWQTCNGRQSLRHAPKTARNVIIARPRARLLLFASRSLSLQFERSFIMAHDHPDRPEHPDHPEHAEHGHAGGIADEAALIAAVTAAGYTNPTDIQHTGHAWHCSATDSTGAVVKLTIDGQGGVHLDTDTDTADEPAA